MARLSSLGLAILMVGCGTTSEGPADGSQVAAPDSGSLVSRDAAAGSPADASEASQPDAGAVSAADAGTSPLPDAGTSDLPDAGTSVCTPDTWSNYASGFFATNCSGCHSWASSLSGVQSNASGIKSRISSGAMPPGGGLSQSDVTRITQWIDCGTP